VVTGEGVERAGLVCGWAVSAGPPSLCSRASMARLIHSERPTPVALLAASIRASRSSGNLIITGFIATAPQSIRVHARMYLHTRLSGALNSRSGARAAPGKPVVSCLGVPIPGRGAGGAVKERSPAEFGALTRENTDAVGVSDTSSDSASAMSTSRSDHLKRCDLLQKWGCSTLRTWGSSSGVSSRFTSGWLTRVVSERCSAENPGQPYHGV